MIARAPSLRPSPYLAPPVLKGQIGTTLNLTSVDSGIERVLVDCQTEDDQARDIVISLRGSNSQMRYRIDWGSGGGSMTEFTIASPTSQVLQIPVRASWVRASVIIPTIAAPAQRQASGFATLGTTKQAVVSLIDDGNNLFLLAGATSPALGRNTPNSGTTAALRLMPTTARRMRILRSDAVAFTLRANGQPFDFLKIANGETMDWIDCEWVDTFTVTNDDPAVDSQFQAQFELNT